MTTIETRPHSLFVGGEWIASSSGATFEVHDPFSGDAVLTVAAGTRDDARRAVEAAASAAPGWAASPPAVRQGIFLRAADILEGRRDEIVDLLARKDGLAGVLRCDARHVLRAVVCGHRCVGVDAGDVFDSQANLFGLEAASHIRQRRSDISAGHARDRVTKDAVALVTRDENITPTLRVSDRCTTCQRRKDHSPKQRSRPSVAVCALSCRLRRTPR